MSVAGSGHDGSLLQCLEHIVVVVGVVVVVDVVVFVVVVVVVVVFDVLVVALAKTLEEGGCRW